MTLTDVFLSVYFLTEVCLSVYLRLMLTMSVVRRVAVTLARPLHVCKVGQSKEKGKTKQAILISDFHAHGSKSSLWPIRLARS